MPASIVYKAAAIAEINDAFGAYEAQRLELGVEFLGELARIEAHLRAVLRRFPYGLFYVVDDGQTGGGQTGAEVNVLACFHLHRDPQSRGDLLAR